MKVHILLLLLLIYCDSEAQTEVGTDCGSMNIMLVRDSCFNTTTLSIGKRTSSGRGIDNIPEEVFELANLRELHITNTSVKRIPINILKIKRLELLYVQESRINQIPDFIGEFDSLTSILLYNSPIKYVPSALIHLKSLHSLALTGYTGIDYDSLFTIVKQTNMEELILGHKRLRKFPESITELNKLTYIRIVGSNNIDLKTLTNQVNKMPNIKRIEFMNCQFKAEEIKDLFEIRAGINLSFTERGPSLESLVRLQRTLGERNNVLRHNRKVEAN